MSVGDDRKKSNNFKGTVDNPGVLKEICEKFTRISEQGPLVFPIHPRSRKSLQQNGLMKILEGADGSCCQIR